MLPVEACRQKPISKDIELTNIYGHTNICFNFKCRAIYWRYLSQPKIQATPLKVVGSSGKANMTSETTL